MNNEAQKIINTLNLKAHTEGGYFSEVYRSNEKFDDNHSLYTSIYFLLNENDVSAFHVLKSDEIWHFYDGTTLELHIITPEGKYEKISLGKNISANEKLQYCVKAGNYFSAEVLDKSSFALVGCTVTPGFEYSDFELCKRDPLIKKFPSHKDLIERLT